MDLGTGDGRLPWIQAREAPERLFVGLDAHAAGLRELSRRAQRARLPNLLYVRAAVEDLPAELTGAADRVTVVLPWGSLLAAVACPKAEILRGIRALCQPGARFSVLLSSDPLRDRAELLRLAIPDLAAPTLASRVAAGYADAGFRLSAVRNVDPGQLAPWPSTWAARLAHGKERSFVELEAEAASAAS